MTEPGKPFQFSLLQLFVVVTAYAWMAGSAMLVYLHDVQTLFALATLPLIAFAASSVYLQLRRATARNPKPMPGARRANDHDR
jgi:hypothetical protein